MADHLKVDPIDLHMSAEHMDVHHAELSAAHAAADGMIEAAQAGWIGVSAAALKAKFADWQATTAQLTGDIAAHGAAFRSAAQAYAGIDSDSAETLNGQL
jgi:WXG100 family type VII secretion target